MKLEADAKRAIMESIINVYSRTPTWSITQVCRRHGVAYDTFSAALRADDALTESYEDAKKIKAALREDALKAQATNAARRILTTTHLKTEKVITRTDAQGVVTSETHQITKEVLPPAAVVMQFLGVNNTAGADADFHYDLEADGNDTHPTGDAVTSGAETISADDTRQSAGAALGHQNEPPVGQEHLRHGTADGDADQ